MNLADAMNPHDSPEFAGVGRLVAWLGHADEGAMSETYRLTRAIAQGDETAFESFHDRYAMRVYQQLLGLTRGDEREAQEVCHQVMLKLAKRFEVFEDEDGLRAWLWRVTKNAFLDHVRRRQRETKLVELAKIEEPTEGSNPAPLAGVLDEVMLDLPVEEAELLNSVYLDKRPIAELAVERGCSYKALESQLTRLRRRVKEAMLRKVRDEH